MTILSFDIESSNGNPKSASLCSFGYCLSDENFNIIEQKDILVNPVGGGFSLTNYRGTKGIKLFYPVEDFKKSPTFDRVYSEIKSLFEEADLVVGFSVINDINYLNCACAHYGLDNPSFSFIDVQDIYFLAKKENNKTGLDSISQKYNLQYVGHRSDEDARVTLLALKILCQEERCSISDLIQKYKLILGENGPEGYSQSYSLAYFMGEDGFVRPAKIKRFLFNNALRGLRKKQGELSGKRYCFSKKVAYTDVNLSRNLLKTIYEKGGVYCINYKDCNVYIKTKEEEPLSVSNATVIDLEDFICQISPLVDVEFKDERIISLLYSKKSKL